MSIPGEIRLKLDDQRQGGSNFGGRQDTKIEIKMVKNMKLRYTRCPSVEV